MSRAMHSTGWSSRIAAHDYSAVPQPDTPTKLHRTRYNGNGLPTPSAWAGALIGFVAGVIFHIVVLHAFHEPASGSLPQVMSDPNAPPCPINHDDVQRYLLATQPDHSVLPSLLRRWTGYEVSNEEARRRMRRASQRATGDADGPVNISRLDEAGVGDLVEAAAARHPQVLVQALGKHARLRELCHRWRAVRNLRPGRGGELSAERDGARTADDDAAL